MALRQNRLTRSSNIGHANWGKVQVTVVADAIDGPFFGTRAEKWIDTAFTGEHHINQQSAQTLMLAGRAGTWSVYAKAGERAWIALNYIGQAFGRAYFDLVNGVVGTVQANVTASIAPVPGAPGWYRCSVTGVVGSGPQMFTASANNNTSVAGDGASGVYIYGAQVVEANWAGPPVGTTSAAVNTGRIRDIAPPHQNLVLNSDDLTDASWTKQGLTVTANTLAHPVTRAVTVDRLTDSVDGGAVTHMVIPPSGFVGGVVGKVYTFSAIVKDISTGWLAMFANVSSTNQAFFNLATGTVEGINNAMAAAIVPLGDGWYRISMTYKYNGGSVALITCNSTFGSSYVGAGARAVYVASMQVVEGEEAGVLASTGATAVNTGRARGIVARRQNLFVRSENFGHAAWQKANVSAVDTVEVSPPPGVTTVQKVLEAAAIATLFRFIYTPSLAGSVGDLSGGPVTVSVFLKRGSRRFAFLLIGYVASYPQAYFDLENGVVGSTWRCAASMTDVGGGWFRCSISVPRATENPSNFQIYFCQTDQGDALPTLTGTGADYTYIGGAQLVAANHPGPYVLTAATRVSTGRPRDVAPLRQNLLVWSEAFDNAAWSKAGGVVVTPNAALAPDGTLTADLIDLTAVGAGNGVLQVCGASLHGGAERRNTKSVWLRGELGGEVVTIGDPAATVLLLTCTLATTWQRFELTETVHPTAVNVGIWIRKSTGNRIFAWGAQVVEGNHPGPYVPTTSVIANTGRIRDVAPTHQNILLRSEEFDHGAWVKQAGVTATANQAEAPDGTMTADMIDFTAADPDFGIYQSPGTPGRLGEAYTRSVWLRADATMRVSITGVGIVAKHNCVLTTVWQRFSFTETMIPGAFRDAGLAIRNAVDGTTGVIYAWGAQSNEGNAASPYVKTEGAVVNTGRVRDVA